MIRGQQMADKLGGRFNPKEGWEDDRCIYILGTCPAQEAKCAYHDILDSAMSRIRRLRKRTRGAIIAHSKVAASILPDYFGLRPVFLIPQHHCNFDNELRPQDRPIRTVGVIGGDSCFQWPHHAIERMFKEIGMEWRYGADYGKRHKVIAFYKELDIQVSFRPTHARGIVQLMNPLKLSNAGSFGIPTVAYPEPAYIMEWREECIWADTITKMVSLVRQLKENPQMYAEASAKALEKAKDYHIDRIARLYEALPE